MHVAVPKLCETNFENFLTDAVILKPQPRRQRRPIIGVRTPKDDEGSPHWDPHPRLFVPQPVACCLALQNPIAARVVLQLLLS